jgi:stage III sporulation protein AF
VELLSSWIQNIILFILLSVVIEMLLPRSDMQKYVRMAAGLVLLILILTPIMKLFAMDGEELMERARESIASIPAAGNDIGAKKKEIQARQDAYILEQTAFRLKEAAEKGLIGQFGFRFDEIEIELKKGDGNIPGDAEKIRAVLAKEEGGREVEEIREVHIGADGDAKRIEEDLRQEIVKYLSEKWEVDSEKLEIVIEGG